MLYYDDAHSIKLCNAHTPRPESCFLPKVQRESDSTEIICGSLPPVQGVQWVTIEGGQRDMRRGRGVTIQTTQRAELTFA